MKLLLDNGKTVRLKFQKNGAGEVDVMVAGDRKDYWYAITFQHDGTIYRQPDVPRELGFVLTHDGRIKSVQREIK